MLLEDQWCDPLASLCRCRVSRQSALLSGGEPATDRNAQDQSNAANTESALEHAWSHVKHSPRLVLQVCFAPVASESLPGENAAKVAPGLALPRKIALKGSEHLYTENSIHLSR